MGKRGIYSENTKLILFCSISRFQRQFLIKCIEPFAPKKYTMDFEILENVRNMCPLHPLLVRKYSRGSAVIIWVEWGVDAPVLNSWTVLEDKSISFFFFFSFLIINSGSVIPDKQMLSCHFIADGRKKYRAFSNYILNNFKCIV